MNRSITLRNQIKKGRFQLAEFLQVLPRRLVLLVLNHLIFIAAHALRLQTVLLPRNFLEVQLIACRLFQTARPYLQVVNGRLILAYPA